MIEAMELLEIEIAKVRSNVERLRHAKKFERAIYRGEQTKHLQEILDLMETQFMNNELTNHYNIMDIVDELDEKVCNGSFEENRILEPAERFKVVLNLLKEVAEERGLKWSQS